MKLSELRNLYQNELKSIYSESEIDRMFYWIAEKILNKPEHLLRLELEEKHLDSKGQKTLFSSHLTQLKTHKPLQYIIGETEFYGLKFFVNENVLIPRPETEELVEWILNDTKNSNLQIIDIGTGTGCIPIVLKKHLADSTVFALDISEKALETAMQNATHHKTEINFIQNDFLNAPFEDFPEFDIIVSNPPYIGETEKSQMNENVVQFEPHTALFVPDDNPLIFYKRIIEFAEKKLNPNGKIYVEINQNLPEETLNLFKKHFHFAELKKDISGNYRMIKAFN